MSTVFILFEGEYSDRSSVGAFSTREKAEEYVAKNYKAGSWRHEQTDIEEHEIDERAGCVPIDFWVAFIETNTGNARHKDGPDSEPARPGDRRCRVGAWGIDDAWTIRVSSPVSLEHAQKVAVELRQKWLRMNQEQREQWVAQTKSAPFLEAVEP